MNDITKKLALALLSQMPEEKLLQALSVVGVTAPDGTGNMLAGLAIGDDENNKIQSWNDRKVAMGGEDRPAMVDKKWAEGAGDVSQAMPAKWGNIDDGVDPTNIFLQTGGGA